jgi:hypothetical protein
VIVSANTSDLLFHVSALDEELLGFGSERES